MSRATAVRLDDPSRSIGYALLTGLAWGIVVTTFESLSQPPLELSLTDFLRFYSRILVHYGASGLLLAWLTARASNLDRPILRWMAIPVLLAASMAVAMLIDRLSILYVPLWSSDVMFMMAPPLTDVAAHLTWNFSVYGGLYVLAMYFLQDEARTRERLRLAEVARAGAQSRMERAMTEGRAPPVPPDLLLRALSELARRYDKNHDRANTLLDKLVRLLRSASGSPGKSHPTREADLAANLDQLRAELGKSEQDLFFDDVHISEQEAES